MGGLLSAIGYGTALFWVIASAVFLAVSILVAAAIRHYKTNRRLRGPILRIQQDAPASEPQLEAIERLLADTGFAYDPEQNIYYSVMNPWQREMGFCGLYDEWAAPLGMVYDCEPVRFDYNGERWLIEFWKGQYGITIGGEIGIYATAGPDLDIPGLFNGTFYHSIDDDEALDMSFTLSRNDGVLFGRAGRHWWLTGFVLGEYSDPSALTMDASVTFPDREMRDAFLEAMRGLGYWDDEIRCSENTVQFTFAEPRSKQPLLRRGVAGFLAKRRLKGYVARYRAITGGLTNMYDILEALKARSPLLFDLAVNAGGKKELLKYYEQIREHLP